MQQILHNMDSTQLKHMLVNLNHFPKNQGNKNETSLFNHHLSELYSSAMCVGDQNIFPNPASKDWICVPKPRNKGDLMWFCQTFLRKLKHVLKEESLPRCLLTKVWTRLKHWLSLRTNGTKIQASSDSFWYGLGCSPRMPVSPPCLRLSFFTWCQTR